MVNKVIIFKKIIIIIIIITLDMVKQYLVA